MMHAAHLGPWLKRKGITIVLGYSCNLGASIPQGLTGCRRLRRNLELAQNRPNPVSARRPPGAILRSRAFRSRSSREAVRIGLGQLALSWSVSRRTPVAVFAVDHRRARLISGC